MVAFLLAEQKLQAVDDWETEHVAQVRGEAEQRRHEQRVEGAKALARMKGREKPSKTSPHWAACGRNWSAASSNWRLRRQRFGRPPASVRRH